MLLVTLILWMSFLSILTMRSARAQSQLGAKRAKSHYTWLVPSELERWRGTLYVLHHYSTLPLTTQSTSHSGTTTGRNSYSRMPCPSLTFPIDPFYHAIIMHATAMHQIAS